MINVFGKDKHNEKNGLHDLNLSIKMGSYTYPAHNNTSGNKIRPEIYINDF